ncbi:MAG: nucleotidyltransferase domain-containing protein [Elusimicrobia bacterium]|nr:nucleotidyltransferase domain-containing protein [Elusimicrobiota bacterium]
MPTRFSAAEILHQESQVRILRFLWKSQIEWSGREIARQVKLSAPTCHQALKELYARGLVLFRGISNVHIYKINPDNYLVQEMFAPLFKAEKLLPEQVLKFVRQSLIKGTKSAGILSIVLFGSMARGQERLDSDLDLLVVARSKDFIKSLETPLEGLREKLSRRFGIPLSPYVQSIGDLREKYNRKLPLILRILKEGKLVYGKDLKELLA